MNGIKESFARVSSWVKSNPKKAGVIAVIIIVVMYFAFRRGASISVGDSSADSSAAAPDLSGGFAGDSNGGFGGGSAPILTVPPLSESPIGGFSGNVSDDFLTPGFGLDSGIYSFPSFTGAASDVVNDPESILAYNADRQKTNTMDRPASVAVAPKAAAPVEVDTSGWSPAKLAGKGQKFTGWHGGIYYSNGWPALPPSSGVTVTSSPGSALGNVGVGGGATVTAPKITVTSSPGSAFGNVGVGGGVTATPPVTVASNQGSAFGNVGVGGGATKK